MARFLYTLVLWFLLIPWAMLHLLRRARRQPEYLRHWDERFGLYFRRRSEGPLIWIHAVSVGETRAALPLVAALKDRYPGHRILFTHMTPTGRQTSVDLFGDDVARAYLPYDCPFAVGRFLSRFRPAIGIIMETELWPNLVAACRARAIPLLLVNARLSEKSARRYARFPSLARQALGGLAGIAAQGEEDAARLRALGAPAAAVLGNMKFDISPPGEQLALGREFRARIGDRPAFLCASTREDEESMILDAWNREIGDRPRFYEPQNRGLSPISLLILVPRHPQRFWEVARLAESKGFRVQRRSDEAPVSPETQVWIGDSMGEMFAYYAAADVAFVGGSLLDYGSQNLIEPCAVGVPVLVGPSTFNFAQAAKEAQAAGAAMPVKDAAELVAAARELMGDEARRRSMGGAGRAFAARHRGATARTLALLENIRI
ncbi:MAG: lipid IV(A) 3-deoxy-D-manno-octulosonic acid transferase [Candidatus Nitricoxidivorans perseverans]|uniref:3-deoxy-D-manno-octulosonic acid transferase n=1 Tax=Candidatus Nitricoxidivorans perseverans TaxID=2975601 RepID=A0AA49IXW1_9PROT|nr:MAG: lipid IV(A) 3-deoxy-D-manno-octulosonic acid transferase [Candidatus Nitricoxidivorans perseverans]